VLGFTGGGVFFLTSGWREPAEEASGGGGPCGALLRSEEESFFGGLGPTAALGFERRRLLPWRLRRSAAASYGRRPLRMDDLWSDGSRVLGGI